VLALLACLVVGALAAEKPLRIRPVVHINRRPAEDSSYGAALHHRNLRRPVEGPPCTWEELWEESFMEQGRWVQ